MSEAPKVGVAILISRGGKLLLVRRAHVHGAGTWSTPGGHLDFGETLEECAIRETREETGLEISNPRFRSISNDIFEQEAKHYITVWMEAGEIAGEARLGAPEEMSEIGWFDWEQLPEPLFLPLKNLIEGRSYPVFHKPG